MPTGEYARWETGNVFLDTLPDESAVAILPKLTKTTLEISRTIAHSGMQIEQVVFPIRSVISGVTRMRDGTDIEVLLMGREGFHGLQAVLGDGMSASEAMVQLANSAYLLPVNEFVKATRSDPVLLSRVLRYAECQLEVIAQFSGCNRLHQLDERCARWLLMTHDRTLSDEIYLTHEFLATMLGVRRAGVTLALQSLERSGLIDYKRGRIEIKDRKGIEKVACECYEQTSLILERLMEYSIRNE